MSRTWAGGSGHLIYEVLNESGQATYVHPAADARAALAVNRTLDLVGFRVEDICSGALDPAGSRYRRAARHLPALQVLRAVSVGRVIHTDSSPAKLAEHAG